MQEVILNEDEVSEIATELKKLQSQHVKLENCKFSILYDIFYLTYFIYLMQADIRIINQESGKSFCIKMPKKRYELSTEDQRKLKLTIERIGGIFKKQRFPMDGNGTRSFNIPVSFIDCEILKYL